MKSGALLHGIIVLAAATIAACGSTAPPIGTDGGSVGGADGGVVSGTDGGVVNGTDGGVVAADGGGTGTGAQTLTAAATGRTIAAGSEEEWCEIVQLDNPEPIKADRVKLVIDEGVSHHAIVQLITPQSLWNQGSAGLQIKGGGCSAPGDDSSPVLIGSQRAVLEVKFPAGVYFPVAARQKLLFNYHYINTGGTPINTNVRLEVGHGDGTRDTQAGALFYNWTGFRSVQPGQESTQSKTCSAFSTAKTIFTLNGHQHQLGTRFEAFTVRAGVATRVYENLSWDDPLYQIYDPPLQLEPGDRIRFTCTWLNTTSSPVQFGTSKDDEMCILGGYVWPSDDLTISCGDSP